MVATMIWMMGMKAAVKTGPFFSTHHVIIRYPAPDPTIPCTHNFDCRINHSNI
jgi:hypothetical protein